MECSFCHSGKRVPFRLIFGNKSILHKKCYERIKHDVPDPQPELTSSDIKRVQELSTKYGW